MTLLGYFQGSTVRRWRLTVGGEADSHGNVPRVWDGSVTYPASVLPHNSKERLVREDVILERLEAYLQPDADVLATDEIEWQGRRYEIEGAPEVFQGWAALGSVVLHLLRSTG